MSKCLLKCGKYNNNNYKFLIFAIILAFLKDIALGSPNVIYFENLKLFDDKKRSNCFLVRQTFCYLFTIIFSYIFYKIENRNSGGNEIFTSSKKLDEELGRKTTGDIEYIHYESHLEEYPFKKLLFIIFLWILEEESIAYIGNIMMHLDFWMLELIVLHYLLVKFFNIEVFKHQKLMLWYCILPFTLKVITIILSYLDEYNDKENNEKDNYQYSDNVEKEKLIYVEEWRIIFIGLGIYSILIILRAYMTTKIKWLIDKKYISASRIFFLYGIMGFFFCLIITIIATFRSCGIHNEYSLNYYFCRVKYPQNEEDKEKKIQLYLDNFITYFSQFFEFSSINSIFEYEIIAISAGAIFFFFYKYCCIRIIEHLTPVHIILTFPPYYILNKLYLLALNFKTIDKLFNDKYRSVNLFLDFFSDVISIFGYLVYLEIIELHFCKYDYNIRRNILERSDLDADLSNLTSKSFSSLDGEKSSFSSNKTSKSSYEKEW